MSDKYEVPNKLPAKQVSILAHRRRRINIDRNKTKGTAIQVAKALKKKGAFFHKAEKYIHCYLKAERDERRIKRTICTEGLNITTPTQVKLIVVMRHRAKIVSSDAVKTALRDLQLHRMGSVSLLKVTDHIKAMIKIVEPYIVWGYPTINTVRDLIFKHGFIKIEGKKTSITSNTQIEEQLGKYGILCIEDIVHQIFTIGKSFDQIINVINPFSLKRPSGSWKNKVAISVEKGGEFGNRKNEINAIIAKCM